MFRIEELTLYDMNDNTFTYEFKDGLNYFRGKNSSGKTEFYNFIDFMFGSSVNIRDKICFKDSLKKASMKIFVNGISYILTRYDDPKLNSLEYAYSEVSEIIDLREYKDKLNSIFAKDIDFLKQIRNFSGEELTYRTFTMFNFLGEKGQGKIVDFFDKCESTKYSLKLMPILNFIFNSNTEKINELQKKLDELKKQRNNLEQVSVKYDLIYRQINNNLQILGSNVRYNGKNSESIKNFINSLKNMEDLYKDNNLKNISELEVIYSNISEQIKVYENSILEASQLNKENINRKLMLDNLNDLLNKNQSYEYLVKPLQKLLKELDDTISFSKYTIKDKTITELKKQRDKLKEEIRYSNSKFHCYSLEEKARAVALIEEYLNEDVYNCNDELSKIRKEIKKIKEEIKILQNADNNEKINKLSNYITELYTSARELSSVVSDDVAQEGFRIKYIKKGNILQPVIKAYNKEDETKNEVNYYTGSMARSTLMQLCGYLGFLKTLLEENKFPLIPILVIDHISKPFDDKNVKSIGKVFQKFYKDVGKNNLQIIMFDDEDYEELSLNPDHEDNLVKNGKSGFNPFFYFDLNI